MPDSSKAVFLSYASQDAEAARRICDALRAAGVEVWFDADGGLEHGDEWDAKIRRQIKECVLFIPIISKNTQARLEGYFRLEWELAAQRAMSIASGVAFILPVVIDDTREPEALVPDRFRAVQWTRLPGGVVTPEVKARYLKLWSHRTGGAVSPRGPETRDQGPETSYQRGLSSGLRGWPVLAAAAAMATLVAFIVLRPKTTVDAAKAPAAATAPASEARRLVAQARPHYENLWEEGLTRQDYAVAEQLLKRALELAPLDGEVWAAYAELCGQLVTQFFDFAPARETEWRMAAEKAVKLAPQSGETWVALANVYRAQPATRAEALRILREWKPKMPGDVRVAIVLASALHADGRVDEALSVLDELSDDKPLKWVTRANLLLAAGRWVESDAARQRALTLVPNSGSLLVNKANIEMSLGEVALARTTLAQVPSKYLLEDKGATVAANIWLWSGEPEKCLGVLRAVPRDFVGGANVVPKTYLTGLAHASAGRAEAARAEWRIALGLIEQRLARDGNDLKFLRLRARLLAMTGQAAEAEKAVRLAAEMAGRNEDPALAACVQAWLGRLAEAVALLGRPRGFLLNELRFSPVWQPLRGHARFEALLVEMKPAGSATATAAASPSSDTKSVAVLPFANQSADKENEYFSDGIADELLTVLQKIPGLRVAARTSAFSFKGKNVTAQEVGAKLGMAHVVEGSVQKSSNRVKITARLSRAATNEEIWSRSFGPLELTDVFAMQSEIAQAIVGELRGRLAGEAAASAKAEIAAQVQAATKGGTRNAEAHQLYLQGKFFAAQFSQENFSKAVGFFRRAVEHDPAFALAWAALSRANSVRWSWGTLASDADQILGEARRAANRALALESDLAEGHAASFEAQVAFEFDWRGAEASAQKALALASSDAANIGNAAKIAYYTGKIDRALELLRQALVVDPNNTELRLQLGCALHDADRLAEAIAEHRRTLAINPTAAVVNGILSCDLTQVGLLDEAQAALGREQESWSRHTALAILRWAQGKQPEADNALRDLIDRHANDAAYNIAEVYGFRGNADQSLAWLERAYRQRDPGICWVKVDRFFRNLRIDPRWPAFLKKVGLHDEQLK